MKRIIQNFSLVIALFAASPAQRNPGLTASLDSMFAVRYDPDGPGGSMLIVRGDTTIYSKSFGYADLPAKERFTENTISNLGSITKTFVAYGILILRDEGKLSLDDSLEQYFPDFKHKEIARKVKIRHLLTHTSGLPDLRPVEQESLFYLTANDEQNFRPLKGADSLGFEPGSRWNYSNPAYNALALIIEKVSRMKWQEFVRAKIFAPSGMHDSRITDGPEPSGGVAHGYRKVNGSYEEYDFGEYPTFCAAGNGGVWSSVNDLKKYYAAMKTGLFLSRKSVEFSQTLWRPANWSDSIPPQNGFSWFVRERDELCGQKRVFHTGSQAGFMAYFDMYPGKELLLILELNSETGVEWADIRNILSAFGYL